MLVSNFNLLEEINSVSKIHSLKRDDIDAIVIEISKRLTAAFRIEKISAWLFNTNRDAIISMCEYDLPTDTFTKENIIYQKDCPRYFKAISEIEILLVPNVFIHNDTSELVDVYFNKHNIISLMDIPLRIDGKLIGVMCFEKTGTIERVFTEKEQVFAFSCALIFSSTLEARQRRTTQAILDKELKEKEILIKEINHRVKNNIAVVSSLINLQKYKAKDEYHRLLFDEIKTKVDAISSIHEMIYQTNSSATLEFQDYILQLLNELNLFYKSKSKSVAIIKNLDKIIVDIDKAIPLALIINEVITNSFKHAFEGVSNPKIEVTIKQSENRTLLSISDNGKGFDYHNVSKDSLGIDIINGLVSQLDGEMKYISEKGTIFMLTF